MNEINNIIRDTTNKYPRMDVDYVVDKDVSYEGLILEKNVIECISFSFSGEFLFDISYGR